MAWTFRFLEEVALADIAFEAEGQFPVPLENLGMLGPDPEAQWNRTTAALLSGLQGAPAAAAA